MRIDTPAFLLPQGVGRASFLIFSLLCLFLDEPPSSYTFFPEKAVFETFCFCPTPEYLP